MPESRCSWISYLSLMNINELGLREQRTLALGLARDARVRNVWRGAPGVAEGLEFRPGSL